LPNKTPNRNTPPLKRDGYIGRYQKIPREERLCEICQSGEVEDEYHFANSCKAYSNQRENFYTTLRNKLTIITDQAQLADIMKSTEHGIILSMSKYISSCFTERNRYFEIGIAVN
jgi:hypothetical protein